MESTIIQTSNQEEKGLAQKKEGDKQARIPNSFYQQSTSQPTSPKRQEEQGKEPEEIIFSKLQDPKNPKRLHGQCFQHSKNLDRIQRQRRAKNETSTLHKEIAVS
ncbi:hypothetical protein O181_029194 [Austropuccinia psidii MF-1]|uniref:Uncharacterized protein n=1 Tax=Austropuccinia psidii MF-1 TaxID=1389203 RepID=A0A9Q3CQF7_9BASI|nr:hypothetical protein [Austropuccinia psidii MF-1]